VGDRESYLYKWDKAARAYFNHFEIHKTAARHNVQSLLTNMLTSWKDPMQFHPRIKQVDQLTYR